MRAKMPLGRSFSCVAALAMALATGSGTAARRLNTTQMASLEKRFEQALSHNDVSAIKEMTSDGATVVLGFSRREQDKPLSPGLYAATTVLSKGEFISRIASAQRPVATGTISNVDEGNRRFRVSDDGFVVTVPATQFVPESVVCMSACIASGFQPDVYVTVAWTRTPKGLRVTLVETSPIEADVSNTPLVHIPETPIGN